VADELQMHGLMPHNQGFPGLSRDWEDLDCRSESCVNNRFGKCGVPSLAVIDDSGRCEGFKIDGILKVKDEQKQE
jgi:hypothetical protein